MDKRLKLHNALIEKTGLSNVYFALETKGKMEYPCIRYDHSKRLADYADDKKYIQHSSYDVTYITRQPTKAIDICNALETFTYSEHVRTYVNDGLYHYLYTITI